MQCSRIWKPGGLPSKLIYTPAIIFFLFIIFLPPVYILYYGIHADFTLDAKAQAALLLSFKLAAAVTVIDVVFGLPLAWILARCRFRHRLLVDTFIDMPLVVPTSILGISVFMFWGGENILATFFGADGGLIARGPLMIILLHTVFTFPYIVRSIEAAIRQIDKTHEEAATMLGASPLTRYRTISLPLFKYTFN